MTLCLALLLHGSVSNNNLAVTADWAILQTQILSTGLNFTVTARVHG
jgi:hypothetical protein